MKLRGIFLALASMAVLGLGFQSASAATVFQADNAASASIVQSGSSITITLTNLTPALSSTSAANLLTGIQLVPTNINGVGFSISSQTGAQEFTSDSQTHGTIAPGPFDPHWALTSTPSGLYFNGFGTGGLPIIGTSDNGSYNNASNGFFQGHPGPFIYQTAVFTIGVPNTFDLGTISSVNFLFNTTGNITVPSTPHGGDAPPTVPLPAAVWSGGALIVGLAAVRRMMRKAA